MPRDVVAIHQPNYLPWLGWFAKALAADRMILLDDVQFSRGSYTHRVRVKTPNGPTRLTVPVKRPHGAGFPAIDAVEISHDRRWAAQHAGTLRQSYGKTPGWSRFGPAVEDVLASGETSLLALNLALLELVRDGLAIHTPFVRASSFGPRGATGSAGIAELCKSAGAGTYLSGSGARSYNDPEHFAAADVALSYSSFAHPTYDQPHGDFEPGLSALDLLFSAPDEAPAILRSGLGD